jgi:hypothetical protein
MLCARSISHLGIRGFIALQPSLLLLPPLVVLQVPFLEEPPQWRPGLVLQDGKDVTPELTALLAAMLRYMNEAARVLPVLRPIG